MNLHTSWNRIVSPGAMKSLTVALATLCVGAGTVTAHADSITGANGHHYDIIFAPKDGSWTWTAAKADAEARGGYLATITSAQEKFDIESHPDFDSAFDRSMFNFGFGPCIGGFLSPQGSTDTNNADAPGDPTKPRNGSDLWYWVNGEGSFSNDEFKAATPVPPGTFTDWLSTEPNHNNGAARDEFFLAYGDLNANPLNPLYGWADMPNSGNIRNLGPKVHAYVLEIVPTPLAASVGLLMLGGLVLRRRAGGEA